MKLSKLTMLSIYILVFPICAVYIKHDKKCDDNVGNLSWIKTVQGSLDQGMEECNNDDVCNMILYDFNTDTYQMKKMSSDFQIEDCGREAGWKTFLKNNYIGYQVNCHSSYKGVHNIGGSVSDSERSLRNAERECTKYTLENPEYKCNGFVYDTISNPGLYQLRRFDPGFMVDSCKTRHTDVRWYTFVFNSCDYNKNQNIANYCSSLIQSKVHAKFFCEKFMSQGSSICVGDCQNYGFVIDTVGCPDLRTCRISDYILLSHRSNTHCANNPSENIEEIDLLVDHWDASSNSLNRRALDLECKEYCLKNNECKHLIVDFNLGKCRLFRSCIPRKITYMWGVNHTFPAKYTSNSNNKQSWPQTEMDWNHYRLDCPERGGCDWRHQFVQFRNSSNGRKLSMQIANAPWTAFNPIPFTNVIYARTSDGNNCDPNNTDEFNGKIVLFVGTDPKPEHTVTWRNKTRFCGFGDMVMKAQKYGARAAFVVFQQNFHMTVFDEVGRVMDNDFMIDPEDPEGLNIIKEKRPNITAGMIVYQYWRDFEKFHSNDNTFLEGAMSVGCIEHLVSQQPVAKLDMSTFDSSTAKMCREEISSFDECKMMYQQEFGMEPDLTASWSNDWETERPKCVVNEIKKAVYFFKRGNGVCKGWALNTDVNHECYCKKGGEYIVTTTSCSKTPILVIDDVLEVTSDCMDACSGRTDCTHIFHHEGNNQCKLFSGECNGAMDNTGTTYKYDQHIHTHNTNVVNRKEMVHSDGNPEQCDSDKEITSLEECKEEFRLEWGFDPPNSPNLGYTKYSKTRPRCLMAKTYGVQYFPDSVNQTCVSWDETMDVANFGCYCRNNNFWPTTYIDTNMKDILWEKGNCRGSVVWDSGRQWDCIPGQYTLDQCKNKCVKQQDCANFESTIQPGDYLKRGACCLFKEDAIGNGYNGRWCYKLPAQETDEVVKIPTFAEITNINSINSGYKYKQCVGVNYPNIYPGYYVCGCVSPQSIKIWDDISQIVSLEPCWQAHHKSPRFCRRENGCADNLFHLFPTNATQHPNTSVRLFSNASNCEYGFQDHDDSTKCNQCPSQVLYLWDDTTDTHLVEGTQNIKIDPNSQIITDLCTEMYPDPENHSRCLTCVKTQTPLFPYQVRFSDHNTFSNTSIVCANEIRHSQIEHEYDVNCWKRCMMNPQCHWFSHSSQDNHCLLHVNCDSRIKKEGGRKYTIKKLMRDFDYRPNQSTIGRNRNLEMNDEENKGEIRLSVDNDKQMSFSVEY